MPATIEPVSDADEADLAALARECFAGVHAFDEIANARGLIEGARSGRVTVLVARVDGACAGYVNLRPWLEGGWIDQVAVGRAWRRAGIASQLVQAAVAAARRRGMRHVASMVSERDAQSTAVWRRTGWTLVGRVEGALGDDGDGLLFNCRVGA